MGSKCPFSVGDEVIFVPSERTKGWYQQIFELMGLIPGRKYVIKKIVEDTYLYFDNNIGGFPWTDFKKPGEKE
ncbi:hypothetical protein [Spirochaeta thermophila]|uniref:Uncharacterized protein n=1 Tax=Winmispira thermophila (strain ATCC 49972 / DSM 6192 / RI 19.B1) TaxID=665571 RepID=E0RRE6_WINT6|nr:hypothetical protein [Spirochaeta thermophila]ADN01647.1 hypothetical protein STHERM_c06890 [Spirochaeta thermophila DSM 6192]